MSRQASFPDGAERIRIERRRQRAVKGYDPDHDFAHDRGELALAAACYASPVPLLTPGGADPWPWDAEYDKRGTHGRERELEKAGALIAAELDRLAELRGERIEERGEPCGSCRGSGRRCATFVARRTLAVLAAAGGPQTSIEMSVRMGLGPKGTAMAMRLERLRAARLCQRVRKDGVWRYMTANDPDMTRERALQLGHAFPGPGSSADPNLCYQCGEPLELIPDCVKCARGQSSAAPTDQPGRGGQEPPENQGADHGNQG